MITKLTLSGLKGQEREHLLGPLTLLKGPNGSGKTATLQAMMIGFLGYEPRLGRRPEATMSLAENGRMTVEIGTGDGFGVSREFALDAVKRTVSQDIRLTGRPEQLQKEAEAEIAGRLGNFPVMFDLAEFTAMSPDKQRDFIFHLSPLDGRRWNAGSVLRHIIFRAITACLGEAVVAEAMKLKGRNGGVVAAFTKLPARQRQACVEMLFTRMDGAYRAVFAEILGEIAKHCSEDVQSSLAGMLASLKSRGKEARAKKAESEAAVRALMEEKARHEGACAGAEELRAALAEAEAELSALEKQSGAAEEKGREAGRKRERLAALEAEGFPDINALKREMDECSRAIESIPEAGVFSDELRALDEALAADSARRDAALRAKMEIAQGVERLRAEVERLDGEVGMFREGRCPVCGAPAESAHIVALVNHKKEDARGLKAQMEEKRRALEAEEKVLEYFEAEMKSISARKREAADRIAFAVEAARAKERELGEIERRLALACRERSRRAEEIASLKRELELAHPQNGLLKGSDPFSSPFLEECGRRVAELRGAVAEKERERGLAEAMAERIALARRGVVEHLVVSDLTAAAKGLRDALVAEIIGPLRKTVDEILPEINPEYRSYFALEDMRGKESFEFGRVKGAQRIPFASLSGGETVLFSTALVTALILRANPPEKVLLVEMGELDEANARALLGGLTKLSRHLDNVIVASCHGVEAPEGWETVELAKEAANNV